MVYERVVDYTTRNGMSIREFERMCGLSNGTVGKWRKAEPKVETIHKISDATHIPVSKWVD